MRCGGDDGGAELSVDHVVPWVMMKADEALANHPDNLASLCRSCHGVKTAVTEPRLLRGDTLALREFYGRERAGRALALWGELAAPPAPDVESARPGPGGRA